MSLERKRDGDRARRNVVEWIVGRLRVTVAERVEVLLDMEKIVEIGGFVELKCFVGN